MGPKDDSLRSQGPWENLGLTKTGSSHDGHDHVGRDLEGQVADLRVCQQGMEHEKTRLRLSRE